MSARTDRTVPAGPLRRRPGIVEEELLDEVLLYCRERDLAASLNRSARAIWELIDGRRSVADIADRLGRQLGCSGDELLSDVQAAVGQLNDLGLLVSQ